ncbi:MAG: circadian clock KaiB family protein [Cyanobacteria bacterium J06641_5]
MTDSPAANFSLPTAPFKGIALLTPGGDLVYCLDPCKRQRWHAHLCEALQQHLDLPEVPHFLVPGYTATVDRWLDPSTGTLRTSAELYPPVRCYRTLLAALFETPEHLWHVLPWQETTCDPLLLAGYRDRFPQLWENHHLVLSVEVPGANGEEQVSAASPAVSAGAPPVLTEPEPNPLSQGYVLQLFVSGHDRITEKTLQVLHELLEGNLAQPYTLKIVDVLKHPEQAEANHISATPTLLRLWPQPVRRIVGDLMDPQRLLRSIGVLQ